ncbi:TetR/AcrR family transcriptional regulator [Muricoccus radiodurans]|uniref:TetR/AcrR family transcriptional regulator n=1 Tax=Muricoccus radiodurans TaxID=2231721 RepID=UPI003CE8F6BF
MARSSREQVAQNRQAVLETASRLFKERGIEGVSVAEVMGAAGLTHGGFYGHFPSKEALAAEACEQSFARVAARWEALGDTPGALQEAVRHYLGAANCREPGRGCPAPALAAEAARDAPDGPLRRAFTLGMRGMAAGLERMLPGSVARRRRRQRALAALATLVGAVLLARAVGDDPLGEEMLAAVQAELAG